MNTPGARVAEDADALAAMLAREVQQRIASGQLRIVAVSALHGQLRAVIEDTFGPLQHGAIIVAERG